MDRVPRDPAGKVMDYQNWDTILLINYISQLHHRFVYTQTKFTTDLARKVAASNRLRHPEINKIAEIFAIVGNTLELAGTIEEKTLFPYIKQLSDACKKDTPIRAADFGPVSRLVNELRTKCDLVIDSLSQIRKLTNDYVAPPYSSSTCPILYKLLEGYEEDSLLHLHLENDILFPRALAMEDVLRSKQLIV